MTLGNSYHSPSIILSIIAALMLTIIPLPSWLEVFRPEWVALVIIYWCIALPQRVGVGFAWTTGVLLDVLRDSLLGQHALSLTIVAFIAIKLHQRIRLYPIWQQALSVMVLITLNQLLILWINGLVGHPSKSWTYWLPSISSVIFWPLLDAILRGMRGRSRVT